MLSLSNTHGNLSFHLLTLLTLLISFTWVEEMLGEPIIFHP